jgi:hypothetical protein
MKKEYGGLGIPNLQDLNICLVGSWIRRYIHGEGSLWKRIVDAKYNTTYPNTFCCQDINPSVFWKGSMWASRAVKFGYKWKIGNGRTIRFWKNVWVAGQSLEERFPSLFGISTQQEAMLSEVGWWENGVWSWGLLWRRNFFVWEENLLLQLRQVLAQVTLSEADRIGGCGFREVRMFLA